MDIAKQVKALEQEFNDSVNSNGAPEKHIPDVSLSHDSGNPDLTTVQVTVPHVMDPEKPHWIEFIWIKDETSGDVVVAKAFSATDPASPSLTYSAPKGARLTPYAYCNLHGLWKGDTYLA